MSWHFWKIQRIQEYGRRAAGLPGILCLVVLLLAGAASPAEAQDSREDSVARVFVALLESREPATRLEACFLAAGLPERPEIVRVLRRRLTDAQPLERVVTLYALAAMTRSAGDCDAFLDAFPTEPQLFFDLLDTEWNLVATFNTGLADFLLLLACEPRTRQKALPHLGRLLVNMPAGVEGRGELLLDPLVRGYLAGKEDHLKLDGSLWRKAAAPDFSRQDVVTEKILSLARSDVPEVGVTAVLLAHRMFLSRELIQATDTVRQALPEHSLWREFFQIFYMDAEDVDTLLAFDPGRFVALLRLERSLYRPPLRGVVDAVWRILQSDAAMREQKEQGWSGSERHRILDAAERARLAAFLEAVLRDGGEYLEVCEQARFLRYVQENRAGAGDGDAAGAAGIEEKFGGR